MTVEYSEGYKQQAQKRLDELKKVMTPHAWLVAKLLSEHFKGTSTKCSH